MLVVLFKYNDQISILFVPYVDVNYPLIAYMSQFQTLNIVEKNSIALSDVIVSFDICYRNLIFKVA